MEEKQKKKRLQPGMMQANETRPRSSRARHDESTRPLVTGTKRDKNQGAHGGQKKSLEVFNQPFSGLPVSLKDGFRQEDFHLTEHRVEKTISAYIILKITLQSGKLRYFEQN